VDAVHGRCPSPSGADLRNALRATRGDTIRLRDGSLDERPRAAAGLPPSFEVVSGPRRYARYDVGRQTPAAGIAVSDVCSRDFIAASKSERAV